MTLDAVQRTPIAEAFRKTMPTIEALFHTYAIAAGAPQRLAIGVYDATDAGTDYLAGGDSEARAIAEHAIRVIDWGERSYTQNARNKVRAALRLERDSGDIARRSPDLFAEGDMRAPGACLAEVGGNRVCVATSGLRGTEDEPFALLTIELMKRLLSAP